MTLLVASSQKGGALDAGPNPLVAINSRLWRHIDILNHPGPLTDTLQQISLVWAVIFLLVGGLCLLNGYRWHKVVIVVLAVLTGIWAGTVLGQRLGNPPVIAACLAVLLGVVAWPGLKYAVAVFGGLAGAFAGANLWTAAGFEPGMHQMGAVIGLITLGMLTFLAFRWVVIALTVVGGSSLLVFGVLAGLMRFDAFAPSVAGAIDRNPLMVPIIAGSAAAVGVVVQFVGGVQGLKASADRAESSAAGGGAAGRRRAA